VLKTSAGISWLALIAAADLPWVGWEPSDAEYWGAQGLASQPFPVLSFNASLSTETFRKLVREGRPLVVRGLGSALSIRSWDCDFFRNGHVKTVKARKEYGSEGEPQWMKIENIMAQSEAEESEWTAKMRLFRRRKKRKKESASAPYYLGIKDAQGDPRELEHDSHYSPSWSKELLREVQQLTETPAFMDQENTDTLQRTPELWFVRAGSSGGAKAHVDVHQESTMSLQLCGSKRWQVAPIAWRGAPHVMKLYQDGQIYDRPEHQRWNIMEDVVLDEGDALIFPPGFIHQTAAEGSGPAASITWQFDHPSPSILWRRYLPRIRFTPDLATTWQRLRKLIAAAQRLPLAQLRRHPDSDFFDVDDDGHVSKAEKQEMLHLWFELERGIKASLPPELSASGLGIRTLVEAEDELPRFSKKVQKIIKEWEAYALAKDELPETAATRNEL